MHLLQVIAHIAEEDWLNGKVSTEHFGDVTTIRIVDSLHLQTPILEK